MQNQISVVKHKWNKIYGKQKQRTPEASEEKSVFNQNNKGEKFHINNYVDVFFHNEQNIRDQAKEQRKLTINH